MAVRVGIDTGGTFSDFVALDETTGEVRVAKVPSTPREPAAAIRAGLAKLGLRAPVDQVVVGTTVGTNAVIERRGPRVVYVTNAGFTDLPFIGRLDKERLYDLHWQKPKPLVRRRDCIGVVGRVDHHGDVVEPLDADSLDALEAELGALARDDDEIAVAACFLFSYLRPEQELEVAKRTHAALPNAEVSLSHQVSPVWREYERASTTIADAFIKPVVGDYVDAVGGVLRTELGADRWNVLASNGGHLRAEQARERPSRLLLSGLAGGVVGASFYAEAAGARSLFSLDMGGTSCDIGLVLDGEQQYASEFHVSWGIPVSIPCVAVTTIGAGGGSIAWVDKGGLLHVGPRSAGAEPGPAAYGKGGTEPTLSDANLVLGRLDPAYFLGGAMLLDLAAARGALAALGDRIGLSEHAAASAAVRIADENMANAIRLIAVERGLDPRRLALIAFGGAGPLHARAVAARLGMSTVLVPPHPGLCSALGATIAQARVDHVRTHYARSDHVDVAEIARVERELRGEAVRDLRQTITVDAPVLTRAAALRYEGQNYELEVELPDGDLDEDGWRELMRRFETEHERQYGFALPGEPVELINLRVTALRDERRPALEMPAAADARTTSRPVWFAADEPTDCTIYLRDQLAAGVELEGPLIVAEPDSTTLVAPGDRLTVDESGVLVITIGGAW
jgi:N-methylhydantoinase A